MNLGINIKGNTKAGSNAAVRVKKAHGYSPQNTGGVFSEQVGGSIRTSGTLNQKKANFDRASIINCVCFEYTVSIAELGSIKYECKIEVGTP
ncbi:hypothetical protein L9Z73_28735 [Pseudomonas sp. TNT11]|uniref:Uncharacterized protein n=1 Tax=Pseudomonas emilianonis TaxID=2915812 RepID=A0ABT0ER00_9PSED|nr:hypothetical protein [Pseudomonas emilianonis]MCK1788162.1 hypothetical protein [Pseudomonas emilianonis]